MNLHQLALKVNDCFDESELRNEICDHFEIEPENLYWPDRKRISFVKAIINYFKRHNKLNEFVALLANIRPYSLPWDLEDYSIDQFDLVEPPHPIIKLEFELLFEGNKDARFKPIGTNQGTLRAYEVKIIIEVPNLVLSLSGNILEALNKVETTYKEFEFENISYPILGIEKIGDSFFNVYDYDQKIYAQIKRGESYMFKEIYFQPDVLKYLNELKGLDINWTVFADDAPPVKCTTKFDQIKIIEL